MAFTEDLTSGQTFSADSYHTGEPPSKAFDDTLTSAWFIQTPSFPHWIQVQFATAPAIIKLRMYQNEWNQAPEDFVLYGSNTGSFSGEETTLLTVNNINWGGAAGWQEWEFENTNTYTYYRIVITDNNESLWLRVNEIEMMAEAVPSPSESPSESPSQSPSESPSESPSLSPSASESPSESPSLSPSASESPSESPSASPSASESPSESPSLSPSASESPSESPSQSPSESPSESPSLSPSASESPSESPSQSPSESPSESPSLSPSASESPSESPSLSPSASESPSESPSPSPSIAETDTGEEIGIGVEFAAFNWSKWLAANKERAIERYYFTLTGDADSTTDIEIPISSFQARKRTGESTYLSVVIPDFAGQAQAVSDRSNGEMVIEMAYTIDGQESIREEILRADLEDIRTDEGPVNRSIILTGHKTQTFGSKIVELENPTYKNVSGGRILYRFARLDLYLNPGDTCRVEDDEFVIDYITYMVSVGSDHVFKTMELREI